MVGHGRLGCDLLYPELDFCTSEPYCCICTGERLETKIGNYGLDGGSGICGIDRHPAGAEVELGAGYGRQRVSCVRVTNIANAIVMPLCLGGTFSSFAELPFSIEPKFR